MPMQAQETALARAASELTPADFHYLQQHGMLSEHPVASGEGASGEAASYETASQEGKGPRKAGQKVKRHAVQHSWPEVGTVLEAEYQGQHYTAEVIGAPRYKSGRALRITSGPAEGEVSSSFSGAMMVATEAQREAAGLGRKGISSGWEFWKVKEDGA
jgi:hypothetical protein